MNLTRVQVAVLTFVMDFSKMMIQLGWIWHMFSLKKSCIHIIWQSGYSPIMMQILQGSFSIPFLQPASTMPQTPLSPQCWTQLKHYCHLVQCRGSGQTWILSYFQARTIWLINAVRVLKNVHLDLFCLLPACWSKRSSSSLSPTVSSKSVSLSISPWIAAWAKILVKHLWNWNRIDWYSPVNPQLFSQQVSVHSVQTKPPPRSPWIRNEKKCQYLEKTNL